MEESDIGFCPPAIIDPGAGHVNPVIPDTDIHLTFRGFDKSGDDPGKGGFSGAARSDYTKDFTFGNIKSDIGYRFDKPPIHGNVPFDDIPG